RILLLNTALRANERHPKCVPQLPAFNGIPVTRCNPVNPAREVQFVARGQGAVLVAGIDPITATIRRGDKHGFVGDAIVATADNRPYSYSLRFRQASAAEFTTVVTKATGSKRSQALGQIDTSWLAPGDYVVELELALTGEEPVAV